MSISKKQIENLLEKMEEEKFTVNKKTADIYLTEGDPFIYGVVRQWVLLISNYYRNKAITICESYAGRYQANTLFSIPDTVDIIITNPPYLAKNSARRQHLDFPFEYKGIGTQFPPPKIFIKSH